MQGDKIAASPSVSKTEYGGSSPPLPAKDLCHCQECVDYRRYLKVVFGIEVEFPSLSDVMRNR